MFKTILYLLVYVCVHMNVPRCWCEGQNCWVSPSPCESQDPTPVVWLGGRHVYLLSHCHGPYCVFQKLLCFLFRLWYIFIHNAKDMIVNPLRCEKWFLGQCSQAGTVSQCIGHQPRFRLRDPVSTQEDLLWPLYTYAHMNIHIHTLHIHTK